jgi:hypothetical protein
MESKPTHLLTLIPCPLFASFGLKRYDSKSDEGRPCTFKATTTRLTVQSNGVSSPAFGVCSHRVVGAGYDNTP